jgi:hypothetical protein
VKLCPDGAQSLRTTELATEEPWEETLDKGERIGVQAVLTVLRRVLDRDVLRLAELALEAESAG